MDCPSNTDLAVVVPLYNEIENLRELHDRLLQACRQVTSNFALIFVDDNSTDGTSQQLQQLVASNAQVNVISMSRNFGQPAAIMAGLANTNSKCVVLLDGDLQDPPELISELYQQWRQGNQVVIAQRRSRQERGIRGFALRSFHKVFSFLADSKITPNSGTYCLLDRRAVSTICQMPEAHRFFPGLRAWVGFKQTTVQYDRADRLHGQPKQTFRRLFRYALDGIFSFSFKPLRLMTVAGMLICSTSIVLVMWLLFNRVLGAQDAINGFNTLMCAVLCLGGFQLMGMGILGEYIGRIYDEVKRRPAYIVARQTGLHVEQNAGNQSAYQRLIAGESTSEIDVSEKRNAA
jgi:polyisoprenyl-phosphate glycosyltransferase